MRVYCVIGDRRVAMSLSPVIHNSVFSRLGLDCKYVAFSVDPANLKNATLGIRSLGVSGANVTVPYKETIIPFLDELSGPASVIGAVNTIVRHGHFLIGHNTDVGGFGDLLDYHGFSPDSSDVVIVGAGGATRAVLFSFIERGYSNVTVVNRTYNKSMELTGRLGGLAVPFDNASDVVQNAVILVNTTSVSEIVDSSSFIDPFSKIGRLNKLQLVVDINYGRKTNFWAGLAEKNGAFFTDGLYMLAAQARRSFQLWTGETPSLDDFIRPVGLIK